MPFNLRNSLSLAAIAIMAFCDLVFADTVYLKDGTKIENASVAEITKTEIKYKIGERAVLYTIPKDDATKIVYKDGSEDVFAEEKILQKQEPESQVETPKDSIEKRTAFFNVGYLRGLEMSYVQESIYSEKDFFLRYGAGFGIFGLDGDFFSLPFFFNVHLGLPKGNLEYFFNNRIGTDIYGENEDIESCFFCDVFYEPSVGIQFNNFINNLNLSVGYNFSSSFENSLVIRAGFRHHYEVKVKDKDDSSDAPKEKSSRYFRPGIEINYPVYRSEIGFFDNSFPYPAAGAGLFFRIGPEYFYLTIGAYAKIDVLYKEGIISKDFEVLGIKLGSVDLLDLEWDRLFVEIPLLLNFGSGQIRFTGGVLFDFYASGGVYLIVNDKVPILGGEKLENINADADKKINDMFDEITGGNIYTVLGLDIDIMRHWGIGVKCLIWSGSLEESESDLDYLNIGIVPSRFQTRVSTYFVF